MKIKASILASVLLFMIAVSFTVRCLPNLIYRPYWTEYALIIALTVIAIMGALINKKRTTISIVDVMFLTTPWMFLTGNVNIKYAFYVGITIGCYFLIQSYGNSVKAVKYPYIVFAIITSLVTWLSFVNPAYYISHILTMFPEGSSLTYSFLNKNMYHGFTNHYSRNALYITIALMLLFCLIICKTKFKKKIVYPLFIFFFATALLVAKRGPALALIITLFIVLILKEPSIGKKIRKSFRFIAVGVVLFLILYFSVPGVRNMVNRILISSEGGDITSSRFYLWGVAWSMFNSKPFLGHGWGSYLLAMTGSTFQGVHNDYLQYLAETGIVGFIFFLIRDIGALILTNRAFKKVRGKEYDGSELQYWLTMSLVFQIFFLTYSMTGMPHFAYEQYGLYTILCGYGIGQYKMLKADKKVDDFRRTS